MTTPHPLVQSALQAANQGRKRKAREILEPYINTNPEDCAAWYILAHVARTRQEAIFFLGKVLDLKPGNQTARRKLESLHKTVRQQSKLSAKSPRDEKQKPEIFEIINAILTISTGIIVFLFLLMLSLGSGTLLAKAYTANNPAGDVKQFISSPKPTHFEEITKVGDDDLMTEIQDHPLVIASLDPHFPTSTPTRQPTPTRHPTLTPRVTISNTKPPTATAVSVTLIPPLARITGIYGQSQAYSLDCESRSAVDWARHFGITINEKEFFKRLPVDDNPDKGFSGSVNGYWGMVPPGPYGIHAEPVAELLRVYGAKAIAVRGYHFEQIQKEISSGRPVITWVVGKVWSGKPLEYSADDGNVVTVAKYEHTVIVIGYDSTDVTILDGANSYKREIWKFLDSWSVLNNMAIIWRN